MEEVLSVYRVCQLAYRLVAQVCQGHEENEVYCARFLPVFFEHLGMNLGAAHALTTLCQDNVELVEDIEPEIVLRCLRYIQSRGKAPRFLNFLTALSCVRGVGIQSKQELICGRLFGAGASEFALERDQVDTLAQGHKRISLRKGNMSIAEQLGITEDTP